MAPRGGTPADIHLEKLPSESVGLEIVNKLASKGFCVIAPGFEGDTLANALTEVTAFEGLRRWEKVSTIIQDGLLGSEGSYLIAELESPELTDEVRNDGETLIQLENTISQVGSRISPYLSYLNFDIAHRSPTVVHQTGEPDEDEESALLNEKIVMKWQAQFLRHKVMVIIFLGPISGTLELQPYASDDTELCEVQTTPGTMVILRPDLMSHKHYSPGKAIAMSSFFLSSQMSKRAPTDPFAMIPAARELDEWSMGRLKELKDKLSETDAFWNPEIPREWQAAMNHIFHGGQMIAVCGTGMKTSHCDEADTLWRASTSAPDYIIKVPTSRWNHDEFYSPDLDCHQRYMSYTQHASFADGIALFDCKMFSMSPNEAKAIDPHQRLILEIGYTALHNMGMRKNSLVQKACAVYVGCGNLEWHAVPKEDSGAFGATGAALSISSGRFSFSLGLKGPSITVDAEAASGLVVLYQACESMTRKGKALANELGVAIGAGLCLTGLNWAMLCAQQALCKEGRCLTFNSSADGYVKGDGCVAAGLRPQTELVDGNFVSRNEDNFIAVVAGATINNSGKSTSMTSPHGPSEQECIADAIRAADVAIFDVDAVEAFGASTLMSDAIELSSLLRSHRTEDLKEPLVVTCIKNSVGNQNESAALTGFLRAIYTTQWGATTPNLHLRQTNPHVEDSDTAIAFGTQCLDSKMQSSFVGTMAKGSGGTNAYVLAWGQVNTEKVVPVTPATLRELQFWPGGGGELAEEQQPTREYTIVGSWGQWPDPQPMVREDDGVYSYTLTLGENRWEWFQIWLDGEPTKVLHPGVRMGGKELPVHGPVEESNACWRISGVSEVVFDTYVPQLEQGESSGSAPAVETFENEWGEKVAAYEMETADSGKPGDQYRVQLRIAGKWRQVTWERLQGPAGKPMPLPPSTYYIYIERSKAAWDLEEMTRDSSVPNLFHVDITMREGRHAFQVWRNKDFCQMIYPNEFWVGVDQPHEVYGPDEYGENFCWFLSGLPGTIFRVSFQRTLGDNFANIMEVTWTQIGKAAS